MLERPVADQTAEVAEIQEEYQDSSANRVAVRRAVTELSPALGAVAVEGDLKKIAIAVGCATILGAVDGWKRSEKEGFLEKTKDAAKNGIRLGAETAMVAVGATWIAPRMPEILSQAGMWLEQNAKARGAEAGDTLANAGRGAVQLLEQIGWEGLAYSGLVMAVGKFAVNRINRSKGERGENETGETVMEVEEVLPEEKNDREELIGDAFVA